MKILSLRLQDQESALKSQSEIISEVKEDAKNMATEEVIRSALVPLERPYDGNPESISYRKWR